MPIMNFSGADSEEDLQEQLAEIAKLLNFLLNGNLESVNVRELTADKISAGTINTGDITIGTGKGGSYYRIDDAGIVAFNGSVNTMLFDLMTGLMTLTSVLVQSAMGYPKVVLNSANDLIAAYADADTYLSIQPQGYGSVPALGLVDAGTVKGFLNRSVGGTTIGTFDGENLNLQPSGNLQIGGNNTVSGTVFVSATSGGPATLPLTFTKGMRTP
jgi:hypothetical protein